MTDTVVDKLIQEAIAKTQVEIAALEADIRSLNSQISMKRNKVNEYTLAYQKSCTHEISIRETVSHMDGGYDHVSETQYRDVCSRCGKVTGSKLVRGTYA